MLEIAPKEELQLNIWNIVKKDWIENNCLKFLYYFDKTYMQELYGWGKLL